MEAPQRSCAPVAAAEIDFARLPYRALQTVRQAGMQVRRRSRTRTAKLNGLDPEIYLHHVLERIADHPITRIAELFPWNVTINRL